MLSSLVVARVLPAGENATDATRCFSFGTRPEDGYFRVVFLAPPDELRAIYEAIDGYTRTFLGQ